MEYNTNRFCQNCGAAVENNQQFCSRCGTPIPVQSNFCGNCQTELQPGQQFCSRCGQPTAAVYNANPYYQPPKPKSKLWIVIVAIAVSVSLTITGTFYGIRIKQKNNLHKRLQEGDWWTYNDDDIKLYLDFSEDEIEYSGDFGILGNQKIADIEYEVIDGSTIKVYGGKEIDVELDDDSVVFTPSFIDSESFSLWLD